VNNLLAHIDQSIRSRGLFRRGQKILIAVSGGVDSMVLLHAMHGLSSKYSWRLTVAHLNHQLRGRSSDADERLVVRTAKRLGLPIVTGRADVVKFARARRLSVEMAARSVRHDFMARTAVRLKIRSVALAHHADDQLELFFLRLLRGSGSEGLAGMKWRSPSPAKVRSFAFDPLQAGPGGVAPDDGCCRGGRDRGLSGTSRLHAEHETELVRPLLDVSKAELEKYARENRIRFREDASNASLEIQRNRIRHELLPLLRRNYQPALDQAVLRLMDLLGTEADCIGRVAAEWLEKKRRAPFGQLPVAVQRRCLRLQLLQRGIVPDYDLVERLRATPSHSFSVGRQIVVMCDPAGQLHLREVKSAPSPLPQSAERSVMLASSGTESQTRSRSGGIIFDGVKIRWVIGRRRVVSVPEWGRGREFFDAGKVGSSIVLRHWQAGDRFQPIGMSSPVKLQDLFTNQKIPRERRHQMIVAATAGGEVFWVENLRISERFKLTKETIRCLQWQWERFK
jgi:tRNA(Ile)-lysidine synthase